MQKIQKDSPIPYYYQLKEILQQKIDNEELKPEALIPTEKELCTLYGISRVTARRAVLSLVNEGVLYRERGIGTYVSKPKPKHPISQLKGLTEDMESHGYRVETKIISFSTVKATKKVSSILSLSEANKAIEMKRLRIVEQIPYALETVWLNPVLFHDLTKECMEGESFYSIIRDRYSIIPNYARQTVEPIKLNDYEADLLELEPESLALLFKRTTYSTNEQVIEYTKGIYRIDQHKFEIFLKV